MLLPPLPEPTFRTRDQTWVSLNTVVQAVCRRLEGDVSPVVARCTILLARAMIGRSQRVEVGTLATEVCAALRPAHIVVTPLVVQGVLLAYADELVSLEIEQVVEGR